MSNPVAVAMAMTIIKQFEGCKLEAYRDIVGIPTIGYGETQGVVMGMKWTQLQADSQLALRTQEFMDGVIKACPRLLMSAPEHVAACTSLAYNIGLQAFAKSTVCKRLMDGDYNGAADAILMWNKAGGKEVAGLTRRRIAERAMFITGKVNN